MSDLANKQCVPCKGGHPPLEGHALAGLQASLGGEWDVVDGHHLLKSYSFDDFAGALAFTNGIGAMAEAQGHHPNIYLKWGQVELKIWTHRINGLTESDFILAAKADVAFAAMPNG